MAVDALGLQLTLDHDLRGNASMVCSGNPKGIEATHAVIAREAVHDGLVERMAHVQGAGHIGRWQLNGERWLFCLCLAGAAKSSDTVTSLFPLGPPMGFQSGGFKGFGQAV